MRSVINWQDKDAKVETKLPALYKHKLCGDVFLFTTKNSGVRVYRDIGATDDPPEQINLGIFCPSLDDCDDEKYWTRMHPKASVTIYQE